MVRSCFSYKKQDLTLRLAPRVLLCGALRHADRRLARAVAMGTPGAATEVEPTVARCRMATAAVRYSKPSPNSREVMMPASMFVVAITLEAKV